VRGIAVRFRDEPDRVPIGLLYDATLVRPAQNGQMLRLEYLCLLDGHGPDITLRLVRDALALAGAGTRSRA